MENLRHVNQVSVEHAWHFHFATLLSLCGKAEVMSDAGQSRAGLRGGSSGPGPPQGGGGEQRSTAQCGTGSGGGSFPVFPGHTPTLSPSTKT